MASKLVRYLLRATAIVLTIVFTILLVRAFDARQLPDLALWHTVRFADEYAVGNDPAIVDYAGYLDEESAVFDELQRRVVSVVDEPGRAVNLSRYDADGPVYPGVGSGTDWNRSFILRPDRPRGAIVLVHGLTDSPYSMRALAELFRDQGLLVVAPRMPGHGLAPSGLLDATWQDWLAVIRLAIAHARAEIGPDRPLFLGGYSNGGALVVKHTLDALEDPGQELPEQLFLFSPAIGVSAFGVFASWHRMLAGIAYFEKFRWQSVVPEYDPYKYNSFPKMAGHQSWTLARIAQRQTARLAEDGRLEKMPPILTFQSLVDATVLTEAIVEDLYERLSRPGSELVLFDVNRHGTFQSIMPSRPDDILEQLSAAGERRFRLTLVTNHDVDTYRVMAVSDSLNGGDEDVVLVDASWPEDVYSLSHVAIPFSPDDPLYGAGDATSGRASALGGLAPRGERAVLTVPVEQLMRLRYNPFYGYMHQRIVEFLAQ